MIFSCSRVEEKASNSNEEFTNFDNLSFIADSLYKSDNYSRAIILFSELIETKDSLNGDYYYKRAYSYMQLSNFYSPISDLEKAISLNHKQSDAFYLLGVCFMINRPDSLEIAKNYFRKSVLINPDNLEAKEALKAFQSENRLN